MSKPSVAIFGLNGNLGASTLAAFETSVFQDKFQLPVLAVTRDVSKTTSTAFVKYVQGDIANGKEALIKELANVDVVISLLGATPDVLDNIEAVVAGIKPKVYIPSQFGMDIPAASKIFPGLIAFKAAHSDKIRELGIKVVDIITSLFAGGIWLHHVVGHVGIDTESNSVTYLGSPESKFSFSALEDIGKVVVSAASKAFASPVDFPDTLNVQSGILTPADVVKAYETANNTKLEVKEIIPKEKVLEEAQALWVKGFDPSKFLYYLNVLISQGEGAGVLFRDNDNEVVNPQESLWKWSKF
ncbi:hypothetical protein JCM33374_g3248 [Metschnikowia sp. JCM 33374]|nr:hypothetical protein JCM33374_g3248 [Metschnikowia sp. JCM 33374]